MSAFEYCQHAEDHTPCPDGYIQWHAWAETMSKTHRTVKCGECGRWTIWIPKPLPDAKRIDDGVVK